MTTDSDYANQVHLSASPERVFGILTTAAEFAAWWAPATGSAAEGGELRITFDGLDDPLVRLDSYGVDVPPMSLQQHEGGIHALWPGQGGQAGAHHRPQKPLRTHGHQDWA